MSISSVRPLRGGIVLLLVVLSVAALSRSARADDAVPFTDPNAKGSITFCNARGEQMTSGRLQDFPFVFRAIGDQPPPAEYRGPNAKATLYAFQPRKGIDPRDWSGEQMTASSVYSKRSYPIAAGTTLDPSMYTHVQGFPAVWNGLVQLRLLLSAPGLPALQSPYATAVIQVDGKNWRVVEGGSTSCWVGKSISQATLSVPESQFPKATEGPAFAGTAPVVSPSPGQSNKAAPTPSDLSAGDFPDPVAADAGQPTRSSSSPAPTIAAGLGMAILLALAVLAAVFWRRPRSAGR